MSVEVALHRVAVLQQATVDPAALLAGARAGQTAAPAPGPEAVAEAGSASGESFASILESESARSGVQGVGSVSGAGVSGDPGARIVSIAESQIGQAEQPPGSNEGAAVATYRTATAGAMPGAPWCAYFASWVARQAGVPLGASGEGLGAVSEIWSWAQSSGRAIANGPGVEPAPGDLIVFGDEHVGIVKEVMPNGDIRTIEGNYENKVAENVRTPTEATGYVNMQ
jgi:hypothetical protein